MKRRLMWSTLVLLAALLVLSGQTAYGASAAQTFGSSPLSISTGAHHRHLAFDWWTDFWNSIFGNDNGSPSSGGTTSVPEPATLGLIFLGLAGVGVIRRKKSS